MNAGHDQLRPRARTKGLVVQALPDEVLVYDLKRHKAHCLNSTAALIWKSCDGQTPLAEIVHMLAQEMNTAVPEAVVVIALQQLGRAHLLEERFHLAGGGASMSRREVMRRLGWGAAVALPLVTSIVAPTAVEAATCLPGGAICTTSAQCCSGSCLVVCAPA
jgi:Coenzyme PQQ synthesis protein D (PqqD)